MEFGLFSNGERGNRVAADTYDEDLYELQVADRLGFHEAWISEHTGRTYGTRPDTLSATEPFIAKAAAMTKRIRLGPGVRPIAFYHPIQVATEAAVLDHLTRGRYMFGFGVGGPAADQMVQRGIGGNDAEKDRRPRVLEAIDLITRCWTAEEPFDYEGAYYHGKGIITLPKPYQRPHMPVGVANAGSMGTAELAGQHGFMPLFSQYDEAHHMRGLVDTFVDSAKAAGRKPERSAVRVCRFVWVSDSTKKAKEELRPTITPSIEHHKRGFPHHFAHHLPASGRVEDVTWDHLVDNGHYFVGDPDTVYGYLKNFYEESGGFGILLLLAGKDYGTRQQRARSMKLFMEHVAPRLRELDPDRAHALEAVY